MLLRAVYHTPRGNATGDGVNSIHAGNHLKILLNMGVGLSNIL